MRPGTLIPFGADALSFYKFEIWTRELDNHFNATNVTTYDDSLQAATAMIHGDCVAAWRTRDQNLENYDESYPDICMPQSSRHAARFENSDARKTAWMAVKTVLRGRRPFVTESGYMGLLPTLVADALGGSAKLYHLTFLAGCSALLLSQERDDGSYKICGTAFVQGWMEGEALSTIRGAASPQEFWTARLDSPKLRIT